MIDHITGIISEVKTNIIILHIGGIVGVSLQVPREAEYQEKKEATIYIYMHWNQEQGPSFYGFSSVNERAVFELIIGCSGVGPKIALALLAELGAGNFIQAVQSDDSGALSSVPGIGAKKAEQMLVYLKHKVAKLVETGDIAITGGQTQWHELQQALQSLNYSRTEIAQALRYVREQAAGKQESFDQLMRRALSFLAKMR